MVGRKESKSDDYEDCLNTYVSAFDERKSFRMEYRLRRWDGEYRWISDEGIPRYTPDGEFAGYIGACVDITERRKAEEALRSALTEVGQLKDQLQQENIYLRDEIRLEHNFHEIVGESDEIKYVFYKIEQVAAADTTVLITGETGTGKELVARAIHSASRSQGPAARENQLCNAAGKPDRVRALWARARCFHRGAIKEARAF